MVEGLGLVDSIANSKIRTTNLLRDQSGKECEEEEEGTCGAWGLGHLKPGQTSVGMVNVYAFMT